MTQEPRARPTRIDTLTHDEATRLNAPTAELAPVIDPAFVPPIQAAYERRNRDLDPQLVWRGKDMSDWSDLVVNAPPLYIQEKIHPKALIESLRRYSAAPGRGGGPRGGGGAAGATPPSGDGGPSVPLRGPPPRSGEEQIDLFADFNGIAPDERYEAYSHDQHWSNRMILGDGLQVMASLAEREGLKGQVQCIYIDPPYGIKFNSNFQWSTTSRDVKDGKADHLTREPEQVKAFRDTWADGIHSYLTYLRDRLTVARDLLTESGSVFVQIGDENVHRVRALMDEVFGDENFIAQVQMKKSGGATSAFLPGITDFLLWFAKDKARLKYRTLYQREGSRRDEDYGLIEYDVDRWTNRVDAEEKGLNGRALQLITLTSQRQGRDTSELSAMGYAFRFRGQEYRPSKGRGWTTTRGGMDRLALASRIARSGANVRLKKYLYDAPGQIITDFWDDIIAGAGRDKAYVVQTGTAVIQRCILMTTDPGDLVLDPTCGSGTTAYVAEQWGRRWITIDTSRVALALARARIMGARYPWYLLADTPEGRRKEAEVTRAAPKDAATHGRLRQGFVYRRVPHITLKSIANNAEIDTIWAAYQERLEPLRAALNAALGTHWQEWQMPRKVAESSKQGAGESAAMPATCYLLPDNSPVPPAGATLLDQWWDLRIARQREIDASIAAKADTEYLFDQPYEWKDRDQLSRKQEPGDKWRVAGPFTVESLSPHRVPAMDIDDSLFDELEAAEGRYRKSSPERGGGPRSGGGAAGEAGGLRPPPLHHPADGPPPRPGEERSDFAQMVLANLQRSGVQQRDRADRLAFDTLKGWPGDFVCAEGQVRQGSDGDDVAPRRAAIMVGPEYGTVARADLTAAAREAAEAGFDLLIAAAFNFDAHASEFEKMGRLTVLKARINPDLHMPDLANTGSGNLFTVFGEPDIQVHDEGEGPNGDRYVSIEVAGIDMYKGGQIQSSSADDIAVWFVDTDYDYESFFVRHAYFPGAASDPYRSLRTTLKAEIDEDAWASLKRTRSRPFPRPANGRVAVKVINHLGDEVMKVVGV